MRNSPFRKELVNNFEMRHKDVLLLTKVPAINLNERKTK
jgi:hypothetical protein